jgi:hypothetical protein
MFSSRLFIGAFSGKFRFICNYLKMKFQELSSEINAWMLDSSGFHQRTILYQRRRSEQRSRLLYPEVRLFPVLGMLLMS